MCQSQEHQWIIESWFASIHVYLWCPRLLGVYTFFKVFQGNIWLPCTTLHQPLIIDVRDTAWWEQVVYMQQLQICSCHPWCRSLYCLRQSLLLCLLRNSWCTANNVLIMRLGDVILNMTINVVAVQIVKTPVKNRIDCKHEVSFAKWQLETSHHCGSHSSTIYMWIQYITATTRPIWSSVVEQTTCTVFVTGKPGWARLRTQ